MPFIAKFASQKSLRGRSHQPIHKKTIIFLLLLFLVIGCTAGTTKKSKDIDVRVGLTGPIAEFLKNTPPPRIFEGDKFPVVVKIRNTGATNIKEDQAFISLGVENDYTKSIQLIYGGNVHLYSGLKTENTATFGLEGKSTINQKGAEEIVSYNLVAGKVDPQSEFHSSAVIATLCYPYETILDTTICMDTDPNSLRPGKKVCRLQDASFSNGQGSPVAITKIEMQMLPSQESQQNPNGYGKVIPHFLIFLENKGPGLVIKNDAIREFCTQGKIMHEKFNVIYVKAYLPGSSGPQELDCQPKEKKDSTEKQGYVKLKDKKDIIRCTLREGIDGTLDPYLSPLKVEMSYGYTQSISASYIIQKTAR
ncbi:hypothetical protein HYX08_00010 [Candidatus Woesearchaeota archaeon]|nr:hypothetical protein [Candidatus Woesearchaeota archaeon]